MKKATDLIAAMRRNPNADWSIADVQKACAQGGCECFAPTRGSHWKVVAPGRPEILTIPAKRPIKAIYIRKLVAMLEEIERNEKDD